MSEEWEAEEAEGIHDAEVETTLELMLLRHEAKTYTLLINELEQKMKTVRAKILKIVDNSEDD